MSTATAPHPTDASNAGDAPHSTNAPHSTDASLSGARAWFAENGLSRPREGRVIGGVSAAFARRYRVNRLVARIAVLTIAVVFTPLIYIALWVLMPSDA